MKKMDFSEALKALKSGKRVCRSGWNGKGMYIWRVPCTEVKAEWCKEAGLGKLAEANGGTVKCNDTIRMYTVDGSVTTGWVPSQVDMFADDWQVLAED